LRGGTPAEHELGARLACAAPAPVPDSLIVRIGGLCAAAGVDGLRADLVISRAAAALAGWESRAEATVDDVRRVAPLALAHRQRRTPFDEPQANGLDDALDALDNDDADDDHSEGDTDTEQVAEPDAPPQRVVPLRATRAPADAAARRSPGDGGRGRLIGDRVPDGPVGAVAVAATARRRRASGP
jgi:magnesium chelatase subunit D